jgi:hypothetical protein
MIRSIARATLREHLTPSFDLTVTAANVRVGRKSGG